MSTKDLPLNAELRTPNAELRTSNVPSSDPCKLFGLHIKLQIIQLSVNS